MCSIRLVKNKVASQASKSLRRHPIITTYKSFIMLHLDFGGIIYNQAYNTSFHQNFFYLLFGCPTANFGLLSRGQDHSPNVNYCVLSTFNMKAIRNHENEVGSLSPAKHLVGFEPGTLQFFHKTLTEKATLPYLESIQYKCPLPRTGAIRGPSREKLYHELGFEFLESSKCYQ